MIRMTASWHPVQRQANQAINSKYAASTCAQHVWRNIRAIRLMSVPSGGSTSYYYTILGYRYKRLYAFSVCSFRCTQLIRRAFAVSMAIIVVSFGNLNGTHLPCVISTTLHLIYIQMLTLRSVIKRCTNTRSHVNAPHYITLSKLPALVSQRGISTEIESKLPLQI